jgi:hypothetical protein
VRLCEGGSPADNRLRWIPALSFLDKYSALDCDFGPKAQPFCQPGLKRSGGPGQCTQSIVEDQRSGRSHCADFPYGHCIDSFMNRSIPRPNQVERTLELLDLRSVITNMMGHLTWPAASLWARLWERLARSGRKPSAFWTANAIYV